MDADVFCFCEDVIREGRELTITKLLAAVELPVYPADPDILLAMRIRFPYDEEGTHKISIGVRDEQGVYILRSHLDYAAKMHDDGLNAYCQGAFRIGCVFPRPDLYTAELRCDQTLLATTHLHVLKKRSV